MNPKPAKDGIKAPFIRTDIADPESASSSNASNYLSILEKSAASIGLVQGLENQVQTLSNRVNVLESNKKFNWNKNLTIVSVIIALIGCLCTTISVLVAIYVAFVK